MRRLLIAGTAAATAAAVLLLAGAFRSGGAASAPAAAPAQAAESLGAGFAAGNTPALVAQLQDGLRRAPGDVHSLGLLGLAYQQRARETGDPAYYSKSAGALNRALRLAPRDLVATSGLGSLALSRHRFREALALGRRAVAISPTTARSYGVVGDALLELGRYRRAFAAFDRMAALKPGLAAYARVSYARELRGDWRGAVAAMRLALDASIGQREPAAWTHVQLAKLYFGRGRLSDAGREARAALAAFPGYVYGLDALAQVDAARGRLDAALRLERAAARTIPLPQFVSTLGELYRVTGRARLAREQDRLAGAIERLLAASGVRTDLETALYEADHGRPSVALAREARRARPSIDGDDVLAWTLARAGRCTDALGYSQQALRLGTRDALKFFHRGMIERCLGHRDAARAWFTRALALNPHFSLRWAPVARRYAG